MTVQSEYVYTVFFEPVEEGGYTLFCPALPEICTFGETLQEAHDMATDAIKCVLESMIKNGEAIPADKKPVSERFVEDVRVTVRNTPAALT